MFCICNVSVQLRHDKLKEIVTAVEHTYLLYENLQMSIARAAFHAKRAVKSKEKLANDRISDESSVSVPCNEQHFLQLPSPYCRGIGISSHTMCLEPSRISTSNRTLICSAVFAQCSFMADMPWDHIHCSLKLLEKLLLYGCHHYLHASYAVSRYCFWQCLSVCTKSWKLLIRNWCNFAGICPVVNAISVWKLVIFVLDLWPRELFKYFFIHHTYQLGVLNALT